MAFFTVTKRSKKSRARTGVIQTKHGKVLTPSFVPVATKGTLKTIPPKELGEIGVQLAFVNTFHLTVHPGVDVIKKFGGIHKYSKLNIPLMSDSAGFQVFSLGDGKQNNKRIKTREGDEVLLKRIDEKGVKFHSPRDGKEMIFTPELSIKSQEKIGADLIMAFDECIYHNAGYKYTKEATDRTHRWLLRCIKTQKKSLRQAQGKQYLYGIIQGGIFKDLREESAKFVAEQKTAGVAIGGVAIGETSKEIREQVRWVAPYLPKDRPVHLLGIGRVEDILDLVGEGIDTFDCVEPTRLARNGVVYQQKDRKFNRIDLMRSRYLLDKNPIQKNCRCYTCQNFSLSYLHHLFKEHELLGYYLATYHNLYFFAELFQKIRKDIQADKL